MSASKGRTLISQRIHTDRIRQGSKIGNYTVKGYLNHGSYGSVVLATRDGANSESDSDDALVAIKCIPLNQYSREIGIENDPELKILMKINENIDSDSVNDEERNGQNNVVKFIEYLHDDVHCYIVMEYCSLGDIYESIVDGRIPCPSTSPEIIRALMLQIIDGLEFLHSIGIYHRDLKPENLLLFHTGGSVIVKISDFGLATEKRIVRDTGTGSDRYMSPEQYGDTSYSLVNGTYDSSKADIWALGVIFLNILFSKNPFKAACETDPIFADFVRDPVSLFDVFPILSNDSYQVLQHCLCIDPSRRDLDLMRKAILRAQAWTTDGEIIEDVYQPPIYEHDMPISDEILNSSIGYAGTASSGLYGGRRFELDGFVDGQYASTTANRKPLRTPSLCQAAEHSEYGRSWEWDDDTSAFALRKASRAMDEEDELETKRTSNHLKVTCLNSTASLATLWEQDTDTTPTLVHSPTIGPRDIKIRTKSRNERQWINSCDVSSDSGIGTSLASTAMSTSQSLYEKRSLSQDCADYTGGYVDSQYSSAPMPHLFFPRSVKGTKDHLKFSRSWCDLSDSEDIDDFNAELLSSSNGSQRYCDSSRSSRDEKVDIDTRSYVNAWDEEVYFQMA